MTGKDIVKEIMAEEDVTNAQLANRIGVTQATMWARLNNQSAKDLQLSVFNEMLEALGYELVVRKKVITTDPVEKVLHLDEAKPEGRGRPRIEDKKQDPTPDGAE